MNKSLQTIACILLALYGSVLLNAQTSSTSSHLVAQPAADRTVYFNLSDTGTYLPITWGLDLAWLEESHIKRGIGFMGKDRVSLIRSCFVPENELLGDTALQGNSLTKTNSRLNIINKYFGTDIDIVLNCDHEESLVNSYYVDNAANWAKLIDITSTLHKNMGFNVVSVSPLNEPDLGWGQFTGDGRVDFYDICGELRNNSNFDGIRLCGGNTLNTDQALNWYNFLKGRLEEGCTHQLAGSFDNYANFFKTVRANGHHATADELHNVMEAMVGVEYGMQTGIWWGTAEYARGEFVKASDGRRIGYAEHRDNWTAASVYRAPDGKIQAFGGTSERQAATTTYRFVSTEKDVFYDGHGPQREYILELPGGTGYQVGQTNAECVVNISYGDDVQPVINGYYLLVNRNSGKVMEIEGGSSDNTANIQQGTSSGANYQKWRVIPVSTRIGNDFSYYSITSISSNKALDVLDRSLEDGGNMIQYTNLKDLNQQWYIEYVEDGWFYIRSRLSSKCLEVSNDAIHSGANIWQWAKDGGTNQHWRFIPVDAPVEFDAPSAPTNLTATANPVSIKLDWTASPETDVAGYNIYRAQTAGGEYSTIARNIEGLSFVDNTCSMEEQYFYVVKAVDNSLNQSGYSNEASAEATGEEDLIAHFKFEENTLDSSIHLNHGSSNGGVLYVKGITYDDDDIDTSAITLDGADDFVQLPYTIANHQEISILTWVYWSGSQSWQRIFDFGNNENQYMYLSPRLRFAIKDGGQEQRLEASSLTLNEWVHVAVTLGDTMARMYVNGELVDESSTITLRPLDFKPTFNYLGRGQLTIPLFNGSLDDFMVYNYALTPDEVARIHETGTLVVKPSTTETPADSRLMVWPLPAKDILNVRFTSENYNSLSDIELYDIDGKLLLSKKVHNGTKTELNISGVPSGIYLLKLTSDEATIVKKLIIRN